MALKDPEKRKAYNLAYRQRIGTSNGKCKRHIRHGMSKSKLYGVWSGMKQRCYDHNALKYKYYGGKGIRVCPEWHNDFTLFRDWAINQGWMDGLEIDRINSNGNYEPINCRIVSKTENLKNRSPFRNRKLTQTRIRHIQILYNFSRKKRYELAHLYGVSHGVISRIIQHKYRIVA